MKKRIYYLILVLAIMSMAIVSGGCSGSTSTDTETTEVPETSTEVPGTSTEEAETPAEGAELIGLNDFSAVTSGGEKITQSYFENYDVTIINIWGTFCPPCIEEMPQIAEIDSSKPENIGLLLVCTDGLYEPEYMKEILDEAGFEGTCLVAGDGDITDLVGQVQFVPTTIFVDSEGNLAGEPVVGASADPKASYYRQINKYLEGKGLETID